MIKQRGFALLLLLAIITGLISSGYMYFLYQKSALLIKQEKVLIHNIHLARETLYRKLLNSESWKELMEWWPQSKEYTLLLTSSGHSELLPDSKLRIDILTPARAKRIAGELAGAEQESNFVYLDIRAIDLITGDWIVRTGATALMNTDLIIEGSGMFNVDDLHGENVNATDMQSEFIKAVRFYNDTLSTENLQSDEVEMDIAEATSVISQTGSFLELEANNSSGEYAWFQQLETGEVHANQVAWGTGSVTQQAFATSASTSRVNAQITSSENAQAELLSSTGLMSQRLSAAVLESNSSDASFTEAKTVQTNHTEATTAAIQDANSTYVTVATIETAAALVEGVFDSHTQVFLSGESGYRLDKAASNLETLTDQLFHCVEVSKFCVTSDVTGAINLVSCDGCIATSAIPYFTAHLLFKISECGGACRVELQFSEYFTEFYCSPALIYVPGNIECSVSHHMTMSSYFEHDAIFELYDNTTNELLDTEVVLLMWTI